MVGMADARGLDLDSTSPARGPSRSTVSMVSGAPAFQATAARVFMGAQLLLGGVAIVAVDCGGDGDGAAQVGVVAAETVA
jgi:hypothetical protein